MAKKKSGQEDMLNNQSPIVRNTIVDNPDNSPFSGDTVGEIQTDSSPLIQKSGAIKSLGQDLTERTFDDAQSKEDVQNAVAIGREVDSEVELNSDIVRQTNQVGQQLKKEVGYDPNAEREIDVTERDINQAFFSYSPEVRRRMSLEAQRAGHTPKSAVLERLGVSEYYPDISKGIQVGSISSSMLGSRGRYVAQGGLVPWGIVDARKRALQRIADEKAQVIDKIKAERHVTSPQFQQQYDDFYINKQNEFFDMAGDDISVLGDMSTELGREYAKFMSQYKRAYEANTQMDAVVDDIFEKYNKGEFVPDYILNKIDDWNTGRLDIEKYIVENGNIFEIADLFKSYDNTTKWADGKLKDIKDQKDEFPISMKGNVDFSDPKIAKDAQDAILNSSNMSYDKRISAVSKYYDINKLVSVIDEAYANNRFYQGKSQEELDALKSGTLSYMLGSLGTSVEMDVQTTANQRARLAELAFDKEKWSTERKDNQTYYQNVDETAQGIGVMMQDILGNDKLTPEQKDRQLNELFANNENYDLEASKRNGYPVFRLPITSKEQSVADTYVIESIKIGTPFKDGKDYSLSDYPSLQAKVDSGEITNESEIAWIESHKNAYDAGVKNGGRLRMYTDSRHATVGTTYQSKDGGTKIAFGRYMSATKPTRTILISSSTTYIDLDDEGNEIVKPLGSGTGARTFADGSSDAVKTEYDSRDPSLSKESIKLEEAQGGGSTRTSTSRTTSK